MGLLLAEAQTPGRGIVALVHTKGGRNRPPSDPTVAVNAPAAALTRPRVSQADCAHVRGRGDRQLLHYDSAMSESLAFSTTEAAPSTSGSLIVPRPNTPGGGPDQREGISFAAKLNILLVCAAALGASVVTTLADGGLPRDWTTFIVLA